MKEVETFEFKVKSTDYLIRIYSVELNILKAFCSKAVNKLTKEEIFYRDHNGVTYYFTNKEDLKQLFTDYLLRITLELK